MQIGLISVTKSRKVENLGLERIATYLRGKEVDVYFSQLLIKAEEPENDEEYYIKFQELIKNIPEGVKLFGFSINFDNALFIYKLASLLKKKSPDLKVFVGSKFATSCYKFILKDCEDIDFVVRGDGEIPIFRILEAYRDNKLIDDIEGVATRENIQREIAIPKTDLTQFKFIDRDMLHRFKLWRPYIQGSEGCVGKCNFCNEGKWKGRPVKDIFEEIRICHEKYGYRTFFFIDSTFDDPGKLGKQRVREFCNLVLDYPVKFSFECHLRAETFNEEDKELLHLMKKAGFTQVFVGIESGNDKDLELYGKIATVEDNYRALKLFRECDIHVISGFIMFHPSSDEYTVAENYRFLSNNREEQFLNYLKKMYLYYDSKIYNYYNEKSAIPNFNYLRPDIYDYEDEFISQIDKLIIKNIEKTQISYYTRKCHELSNTFYILKALFPEEIESYKQAYEKIQNNLSSLSAEYFSHIFIEKNLEYGYSQIGTLEKELEAILKESKNLRMRLLTQKPFRGIFA